MAPNGDIQAASKVLEDSLINIESIITTFLDLFHLDLMSQARDVLGQFSTLSEFYSWETWDGSQPWPSMGESFREIEVKIGGVKTSIEKLGSLFQALESIYDPSILRHVLVLLVSASEEFFTSIYGILSNSSRDNGFQNIARTEKAFRDIGVNLKLTSNDFVRMKNLQQKRHVIVHNAGKIDRNYCKELSLNYCLDGTQVKVELQEVYDYIDTIRRIKNQVVTEMGADYVQ